jgi:hypothetical protein
VLWWKLYFVVYKEIQLKEAPKRLPTKDLLRRIDAAEREADHAHMVAEIISQMVPLGKKVTIVLAPKGYNHAHLRNKEVRFNDDHTRIGPGEKKSISLPRDRLELVTVMYECVYVQDGKKVHYYLCKNGKRLLNKVFTTEAHAKELKIELKEM